jgi:hypothetical protein
MVQGWEREKLQYFRTAEEEELENSP